MNTQKFILASAVGALLLVGVMGCQSSNPVTAVPAGPATNAVVLSGKKTFDIIGRTGATITYSKPEDPDANITTQVVRARLESLGYQYQPGTPDFVVSVAWDKYQTQEQSPQATEQLAIPTPTSGVAVVNQVTFALVARDTASGSILWQSPRSDPTDPEMVTDDQARSLATAALKDFPPSQAATSQASK
jgi:hypothetical protein